VKEDQIALRIFNSIRKDVIKYDIDTQFAIYQSIIDQIDTEMGVLESESSVEDERFGKHQEDEEEEE
jgi:hypothetical protein